MDTREFSRILKKNSYIKYLEALAMSLLDERETGIKDPYGDIISTDREYPPTTDTTFAPSLAREEIERQRKLRKVFETGDEEDDSQ